MANVLREFLIDPSHFNQAGKISFYECCRPLPHVVSRTDTKQVRSGRTNLEAVRRKQCSQGYRSIGLTARLPPCSDHMFAEALLIRQTRNEMPCLVMAVFMKNGHAPCAHSLREFFYQQRRITHK